MQHYAGIYLLQVYQFKYLHTVASFWILLIESHDARNHEYKIVCGYILKASMTPLVLTVLSGFKSKRLLSHDTIPILTMQFGPSERRR